MSTAAPSRSRGQAFEGLTSSTFVFFAELATHNDRGWFAANAEIYRTEVDRPWRRLIGAVAPSVGLRLPGVETRVKTGRVLGRIQLQWPRPGAAYRTGLRATFAAPEQGRRPDCCLFIALDAAGLRAGAEVAAGTEACSRLREGLQGCTSLETAGNLRWSIAGESWPGGDAAELAERLATLRRGSLRLAGSWSAEQAVAAGAELTEWLPEALDGAAWLYERAMGTPAAAGGAVGESPQPGEIVPRPQPEGPAGAVPPLPRALQAALAQQAQEQGVTLDAFILFVLTRAAAG